MLNAWGTSEYEQLIRVIRYVRGRWRLKVAIRGAAIVLAAGFIAFAISAFGLDHFRYSFWSVFAFRLFTYVALAGLTLRFLVLPLSRRVSDARVALYIEEHHPSLQAALLSAVEAGAEPSSEKAGERLDFSAAIVSRLVETAVEACQAIDYGYPIERKSLARFSTALIGLAACGVGGLLLGPALLQQGASILFLPWKSARAASPYVIEVEPGNVAVARGADQKVTARLKGFDSDRVEIAARSGEEGKWERWPMSADDQAGSYLFLLFDLKARTDYFVEASGVRSAVFRIDVSDLPYVKRVDLEYRFPAYTGLSPQKVEDGGDIAALRGTEVLITATPTVRVAGGKILVEGQEAIPLALHEDGALSGALRVMKESFYKIELESPDGTKHLGSPDYAIEVLADQPPAVAFVKPGRDTKVTKIEEVFTEVKVEDDFGIGRLELVYSVNGGPEEKLSLYRAGKNPKKEISAGHTFFLEELGLEDGDFIAYFARATDTDQVKGAQTSTTDIYFMEVRPFGKEYRQAQQGMAGAGGGADDALSRRQREIIAATFKLVRDRGNYSEKEYGENLATLALVQGRLKDQVETLVRRMESRGVLEGDSDFRKIGNSLRKAAVEMVPAQENLSEKKPKEALPPERRALQHLQRAEAVFRQVQVAFGASGSMGGGPESNAEDLADLFELELDKLRNQYETLQRGEQQSADDQVDEALQRLKELASRQQQENERMKRLAGNLQNMAGGGGGSQRDLVEQTEELARKLERLAREKSLPNLMETARRLREAADAMKRSGANARQGSLSQGIAALDRLKDARRLLEKNREARLERDIQEVRERAQQIASAQGKMVSEVEGLGQQGGERQRERMERLLERKDELAGEVTDLEGQLDRLAREGRREQKEASRKLQEAANSIRDNKLKEKIRYSKGVVQGRSPEYARRFEEQIGSDIGELQRKIEEAAGSIAAPGEGKLAQALDKTRELVRKLESLDERVREKGGQSAAGRRGLKSGESRQGSSEAEQEGSSGTEQQGSSEGQESRQAGDSREGQGQRGQQGQPGSQQGQRGTEQGGSPGPATERGINAPGFFGPGTGSGQSFQPGTFTSDEIRQFRREYRERLREAEGLRQELRRQGHQVIDLQNIIERMRAFDSQRVYNDPLEFERLKTFVIEGLKQFEYGLRRELEGSGQEKLFLSSSDEVPSAYRKLVEEYYRSLSKTRRD